MSQILDLATAVAINDLFPSEQEIDMLVDAFYDIQMCVEEDSHIKLMDVDDMEIEFIAQVVMEQTEK
jgi:hypothetical protein